MQPLPNNDLRSLPSEKGKGLTGAIIIHLVLFTVLVFVAFTVSPPKKTEEGILVNFGTDETGMGMIEPSPPAVPVNTSPPPPSSDKLKLDEEPVLTQNTEDAPEVKKVDPEAEKKKIEKIEADKKLREQREAERILKQQEEIERQRIEAEKQRQSDIMNRTKNALANSKNAGTNSTGEGVAGGPGNQGVPTGSVDSKVRGEGSGLGNSGISYDLQGRKVLKLPNPNYDSQESGRVIMEVSVDRKGNVIQAVLRMKGSTTLNEYLIKIAKDAAMQARFEENPDAQVTQKGTITYNFIISK